MTNSAWEGNGLRRAVAGADVIAAARAAFLGVDRDATQHWRAEDWYLAGYVMGARSTESALRAAMEFITALDPTRDSFDGLNEWGQAECFYLAQEMAKNALGAS